RRDRAHISLDLRRLEGERASGDRLLGPCDLREHVRDVDVAVRRRERLQAPRGLCELAPGRHRPPPPGLVPGNGDMDEALVEVALLGGCGPPGELQLLVRLEEAPDADELETVLVRVTHAI